jgi:hypothetical protein
MPTVDFVQPAVRLAAETVSRGSCPMDRPPIQPFAKGSFVEVDFPRISCLLAILHGGL